MTNKQIIIDGCDVSKCIYFQQEDDEYTCGAEECNGAIVACRACDNCHYKNWQRKEQECKSLRNLLAEHNDVMKINELMMKEFGIEILKDITTGDITLRSIKLIELKQECEELKEQLEQADEDIKMKCTRCAMTNLLDEQLDQLKAENIKLRANLLDQEAETLKAGGIIETLTKEYEKLKRQYKELGQCSKALKEYFEKEKETLSNKFLKLKQTLDKIKTFVQKEIEYFDHDPEYQYDWKELMGLIKASEVDDESYLDNHWLFIENKKGEN